MALPAQQIPYMWREAEDTKPSLPKVISNRKGPLCLGSESLGTSQGAPPCQHTALLHPGPHHIQTHKRNSLTRFPIKLQERPIELVEKELGTMSCAQLKDSIQVLSICMHFMAQINRC